ncbi:MAG: hypothetical protein K2N25_05590 [Muribaculaceae bacterium]|nr:hypothetical protein [Muribaculaceae bacterium]
MTPLQVFYGIYAYQEEIATIICNLHSACRSDKGKRYMCIYAGSSYPVIDFDEVKNKADLFESRESRKSVDALALPPSESILCFVELKSWELVVKDKGTENKVRKKAEKYASDLPQKLTDSIEICRNILKDQNALDSCRIMYILVTDISVNDNGLEALNADLSALAGISSNLNKLCNSLSRNIMDNIPNVETRYWECREFDDKMSRL